MTSTDAMKMLGDEDVDVQTSSAGTFPFDDPTAVLASPDDARCTRVRYSPTDADHRRQG